MPGFRIEMRAACHISRCGCGFAPPRGRVGPMLDANSPSSNGAPGFYAQGEG
jgi:hypothetical protein